MHADGKRSRVRKSAVVVLAAGGALAAAGCEPDADYGASYSVPKPEHPAMTAPVTYPASSSPARAAERGGVLPPDHPPIDGGRTVAPESGPSAGATIEDGGPIEVLGLVFDPPEGWVRQRPSSRMRRAQFLLPRAEGDRFDGVVTVIDALGSLEKNVSRWRGQFQEGSEPRIETRGVGDLDVAVVSIDGTFLHKSRPMAPGPGTPRPGYRLYAAVVQAPGGQLFFKGVGPQATMDRWRESFDAMIQSFREAGDRP